MLLPPPRSTRTDTLSPDTTLVRTSAPSVRCGKQPGTASGTGPDPQVLLWERQWPRCSSRKAIAAMAAPTGLLSGGSPREANVGWVERSDTHRPRSDLQMSIAFGSTHPADLSRAMTAVKSVVSGQRGSVGVDLGGRG